MMARFLLLLACLVAVAQAFVVQSVPGASRTLSLEPLDACRTNAKKEKIKRNRDNMRKFKTTGRKGVSRRKLIKKALSTKARQEEAEFIAKCFITVPPPSQEDK